MFVTILRGHVAQENWGRLRQHYERQVQSLPNGLMETFLVQNHEQPTLWQVLTFWQSEESFESVRGQKKMTACEVAFYEAGAAPERSSFQVRHGVERIRS